MLEGVQYNDQGQLLTASFLDYQIPLAEDIPAILNYRTVTPSPSNPLGVKGVGEAGAIASTAAIANAFADALAGGRGQPDQMPFKPHYLHHLIQNRSKQIN